MECIAACRQSGCGSHLELHLHPVLVAGDEHLADSDAGLDVFDVFQTDRGCRVEDVAQHAVAKLRHLSEIGHVVVALLDQGSDAVAEEYEAALSWILHEAALRLCAQLGQRHAHVIEERWGSELAIEQSGDVLRGLRKVVERLQHGNGLGDADLEGIAGEHLLHAVDAVDNVRCDFGDVRAQGVVDVVGARKRANGSVSDRRRACGQEIAHIDEHVLDDTDGGTQPDATGRSCETADHLQQQIEVHRQEGIQTHERVCVWIALIQPAPRDARAEPVNPNETVVAGI